MQYPKLTIRSVQARAVDAPLANPIRTAVGEVPSAPLILLDISTEEGVTGRSYLFAYTPVTLRALVNLIKDLEPELVGKSTSPFERADSGEGDWPFRPMVITDSGDRDRGGGVHFWQLCCGLKGAAGQGRTRWSVDCPGSPWEGPVRGAERPL